MATMIHSGEVVEFVSSSSKQSIWEIERKNLFLSSSGLFLDVLFEEEVETLQNFVEDLVEATKSVSLALETSQPEQVDETGEEEYDFFGFPCKDGMELILE
jgi:hypothetical protein